MLFTVLSLPKFSHYLYFTKAQKITLYVEF